MKKVFAKISTSLRGLRPTADFIEVERRERIFYLEMLRAGMTVFDIGANVGEMTLVFSRFAGNDGEVHAFEACAGVFEKLKNVCEIAGCGNVRLNHLAVSDDNGVAKLHVYDHSFAGFNSLAERPLKDYGLDVEAVGIEDVRTTTIDYYCGRNNISFIDLLKIDVEGAELQVLRGARQMLGSKRVGLITFEFGQATFDMGNDPGEIEDFLKEFGYEVRNLIKGNPVFPGRESVETAKYSMHVARPL